MTNEGKLLGALRKRMRVTRKTAIQHGWSENLTADISRAMTLLLSLLKHHQVNRILAIV
jgi:hypothetical protein